MKTILVTGGNRGIGFEICKQLAESGHRVILAARSAQHGIEAAKKIKDHGGDVIFMSLDLEQVSSIRAFVQEFFRSHDRLDVLINNAAILEDSHFHVRDIPMELMERMLKINLHGPIQLTQGLLPLLKESDDPRVINLSSGMGALNGMSGGNPAYRLSKAAVNAFTEILAAEEAWLKVNSVCPGWVKTEMGGAGASRTIQRGAETPVWLALEPGIPSGKFLRDKKVIDW